MLYKIFCDKFREPLLTFKDGLNVVVGDSIASNSIGKSTILMIIDFVFGGDTYITANKDAIEELGQHEFRFSFLFEKEYFFSRNTKDYKFTNICDSDYNVSKVIKTDEFTAFLKEKYDITLPDLSFRNIIGRYSRVYGKENLNEKKPLQYFEKETKKASLLALIKLFGKYKIIKDYEDQINRLTDEKSTLLKAVKNEFIPKMTKAIFDKNEKRIFELKNELERMKKEIIGASADIEALLTKEILELSTVKSQLLRQKSIFDSKLRRTQSNISNERLKIDTELSRLIEIFPNMDIERIKEVDEFHNSISKILKEELQKSERELNKQIKTIVADITSIDEKIAEKLNIKNSPQYALDRVVDISAKIQELNNENSYYTKRKNIENNLTSAKGDLEEIKIDIYADISSQINTKMNELNKQIYKDNRRAPSFSINGNNYVFSTFGDTGTGTAYANLITFDLSLLDLTDLPALIHDLPLLKNIENEATENIIMLYDSYVKQIFIAIDKIHTYNEETVKIIEKNRFLNLSKDKTLFILNWKNKGVN
ncbi:DUF2326 domain-containing protein [Calidifontibacillus oryziterrae]|uniref:DUF2326 domain-containing protein n=1 Tax=Calidifontibacillus oryziterrae TaxID=1191699 RepID=UPI0002DC5F90|nr:DUF2326 domain-containing protein [Calidifontibacillus oryziterrae]